MGLMNDRDNEAQVTFTFHLEVADSTALGGFIDHVAKVAKDFAYDNDNPGVFRSAATRTFMDVSVEMGGL